MLMEKLRKVIAFWDSDDNLFSRIGYRCYRRVEKQAVRFPVHFMSHRLILLSASNTPCTEAT